jgi:hypothetical protein
MPAAVHPAVVQVRTLFTCQLYLSWGISRAPTAVSNLSVSSGLQELSANQALDALCGYSAATKCL